MFRVEKEGERLDLFLAARLPYSRSRIQRLIKTGKVTVNGHTVKPSFHLEPGQTVAWEEPEPEETKLKPEPIPLDVVYEDEEIVVVNKPAGLTVHPGTGTKGATLVHGLLHRWPEMAAVGGASRPGIVHRLDRDTSGVMVTARTPRAYLDLVEQFSRRRVEKVYLAVCRGRISAPTFRLDFPIGRSISDRKKMSVHSGRHRPASTTGKLEEAAGGFSLVRLFPLTGRTHQLRVHLKAFGHPIAGDTVYGGKEPETASRMLLHAETLAFHHPADGRAVRFTVPPPEEFLMEWKRLGSIP